MHSPTIQCFLCCILHMKTEPCSCPINIEQNENSMGHLEIAFYKHMNTVLASQRKLVAVNIHWEWPKCSEISIGMSVRRGWGRERGGGYGRTGVSSQANKGNTAEYGETYRLWEQTMFLWNGPEMFLQMYCIMVKDRLQQGEMMFYPERFNWDHCLFQRNDFRSSERKSGRGNG